MTAVRDFDLAPIRTDGWFDRIAEQLSSFDALCNALGEPFFAFAMVNGVRITGLTLDRANASNTLVEYVVGAETADEQSQRQTLPAFRKWLVDLLLQEELPPPPPFRADDTEALQLHVGVPYLLLSPLYGYSLERLRVDAKGSHLTVRSQGRVVEFELGEYRERLRGHVRRELERVTQTNKSAINLNDVAEAEREFRRNNYQAVVTLLGHWPTPLAVFLRTPDGQNLAAEPRLMIAQGLSLLGLSHSRLKDTAQGEDVLRLAVQFGTDTPIAGEIYRRLGEALLESDRPGEAVALLRRSINLGAPPARVWPQLAQAFLARGKFLAALASVEQARTVDVSEEDLLPIVRALSHKLGDSLVRWRAHTHTVAAP